jgi:hypothetical protein
MVGPIVGTVAMAGGGLGWWDIATKLTKLDAKMDTVKAELDVKIDTVKEDLKKDIDTVKKGY